jgi:hypothetical protein
MRLAGRPLPGPGGCAQWQSRCRRRRARNGAGERACIQPLQPGRGLPHRPTPLQCRCASGTPSDSSRSFCKMSSCAHFRCLKTLMRQERPGNQTFPRCGRSPAAESLGRFPGTAQDFGAHRLLSSFEIERSKLSEASPVLARAASEEAIHEAELRHREALLGPSHPDLADSLSNLAILYNQRGDFERAQPLYERALRIYEAVYGPSSTEVAHTLTDLAVLHLEQVCASSPHFHPNLCHLVIGSSRFVFNLQILYLLWVWDCSAWGGLSTQVWRTYVNRGHVWYSLCNSNPLPFHLWRQGGRQETLFLMTGFYILLGLQ